MLTNTQQEVWSKGIWIYFWTKSDLFIVLFIHYHKSLTAATWNNTKKIIWNTFHKDYSLFSVVRSYTTLSKKRKELMKNNSAIQLKLNYTLQLKLNIIFS